jgi:LPS export ABC transporter protein LptC
MNCKNNKKARYKTLSLLFLLSLVAIACEKEPSLGKKKIPEYKGASVEFDSVRTIYSQSATVRIKLSGAKQIVEQSGNVWYPKGIEVNMYNEQGLKTTNLRADSGRYEKNVRIYRAYGNVVVVNLEQQQTLYTPQLNWDQNKREISTEKEIKIVTPKELLYGVGLVSNDEFSRYTIKKPTGVFSVEEVDKQAQKPQNKQ